MMKKLTLVCIAMLVVTTSAFAQLAPTNDCTGQPNATGDDVNVSVNLTASAGGNASVWCVYGSTDGTAPTAAYTATGLADCGPLPVELESFSVESGKAETSEPEKK